VRDNPRLSLPQLGATRSCTTLHTVHWKFVVVDYTDLITDNNGTVAHTKMHHSCKALARKHMKYS